MRMARTFTRKEVDELIEAAVAKATAPLLERISELEAELAEAKKNSSNSSKPPSSDLVKPKKPKGKRRRGKRKQGGHERPEFLPEMLPVTALAAMSSTSFIRLSWLTGTASLPRLFWKRTPRHPISIILRSRPEARKSLRARRTLFTHR